MRMEARMPGAEYASSGTDCQDEAGLAEVDGLGVAAVVLYGRDLPEQAAQASSEPRSFVEKSSWLWRWAGRKSQ
jgi:hypothetical protein